MDVSLFEKLLNNGLISENEFEKIKSAEAQKKISVHWDLRTLLYLGILLLVTGLGIFVYKNIDTIGHDVIITFILVCCVACFFYCFKKAKGFSVLKIESPNTWFDYVLLLGCLLMVTFIAYIQYQYNVFGNRWGLATFVPMILLFLSAYYFDHIGVLSLAVTNLAAWAGIAITPLQLIQDNDFSSERIIYTGIILGAGLIAISYVTSAKNVKKHFAFTYKNFGAHLLFVSCIAGMFHFEIYLLWFLVLTAICIFFYLDAIKENSFYFLVITLLYAYIGLAYVMIEMVNYTDPIGWFYFLIIYFIASGIGLIRLLIHFNKTLKKDDGV